MTPYYISQSKVNTWRTCHRKHYYRYVLLLVRKIKRRPLKFGSIIHNMLEAHIERKDPFKVLDEVAVKDRKLFAAEEEMYGNIVQDIRYIMTAYFEYWDKKAYKVEYIKQDGHYAEHLFEVEIDRDLVAKGKMDARAKAKGMTWLIEHKSHKNFPQPDHRWRNLQSAVYIRIEDILGWPKLDGTLWDYIRSKPPTVPQLKQDGNVSTRAIDTLPAVVFDFAKENKLKLPQYAGMLKVAQENLGTWFDRIFTPVKRYTVDMVFADFIVTGREMAERHGKAKDRNIGAHCNWCDYEPLCRAALQGSDERFIQKREYVTEDEWDYLDGTDDDA